MVGAAKSRMKARKEMVSMKREKAMTERINFTTSGLTQSYNTRKK